jgi:hypothetical protein
MTNSSDTPNNEIVPVFGSWRAWYSLVIAVFAGVVGLLWWFSQAFR